MIPAVRSAGGPASRTAPGAHRALLPLGIVLGAIGGALLVQQVFDPFRTDVPLCFLYHLTGLHCPGCGATRAVHALLDGELLLALRNNVLIVVALPVLALGLVRWTVRRVQGRTTDLPPAALVLVLAVLALTFAILRNLPAFWFIAPTSLVGP